MSRSNPIHTFISQLLRAVLSAVFVILCSRWLGPEGEGRTWIGFVLGGLADDGK